MDSERKATENAIAEILLKFLAVARARRKEIEISHDPIGILGKEALLSQICDITTFDFIFFAQLRSEAAPKLLSLLDT